MAMNSTTGMSRVQRELDELREKGLATNQRDKYKDLTSPLTTPEEAQAFLATMRDKTKAGGFMAKPPSNLSADGMDTWFLQQREREKEMRRRRQEAEALLRGYRMTMSHDKSMVRKDAHGREILSPLRGRLFDSGMNSISETLEDPDSDVHEKPREIGKLALNGHIGEEKRDESHVDGDKDGDKDGAARLVLTPLKDELAIKRVRHSGVHKVVPTPARNMFPDETAWRDFVSSEPGARFQPEKGRYHIYASYACPGSHRALIVRALKGLDDAISVTIVHPTWRLTKQGSGEHEQRGWVFGDPDGEPFSNTAGRGGPFPPAYPGNEPDPIFNAYSIREIYEHVHDTGGKYTIPILWDTKHSTIVNNESSDIAYMLNSSFNDFAKNPELDLYTEDDPDKLNEVIEWIAPLMIHGVYRCGFAKTQSAYDTAIAELTEAFDKAESVLQTQRFLTGDTLSDADIRLFVTLLRFDEVYAFYFKANSRLVMMTPTLLNYCREIYQMDGIAQTCNMEQIKAHFFASHAEWNKFSIIPQGLGFVKLLEQPHNRDEL